MNADRKAKEMPNENRPPRRNVFRQEGFDLMGAAFEVYNILGYGMAEEIYQESLEIELNLRNIPFVAKHEIIPYYKDRMLKKRYIPDLFVHNGIVVELKACASLLAEHEAQLFNYMRITHQPVGYLINFGTPDELQWKRIVLSEFASQD